MKTILVTGANGYLASYIRKKNIDSFQWICMTRKDADLSQPEQVRAFAESQDFDICFHTAANATTAICEQQPELAHKINVESTKAIVDVCKEKGARLIFCGTEQSFNGKTSEGPFTEEDSLQSVTVYGQNKIECEQYIQKELSDYIILRYSWMMGLSFDGIKASPSIVKNVMTALLHQKPTLFTCNEKRGFTYAKKLAEQFQKITELETGIYHVSSSYDKSTYEAAVYTAEQLGASKQAIEQYILPNHERYADRFRDYRLNADKLAKHGITFGTFEENLEELLTDFGWK
ncbi:MAG: sugar nucleotide-binding protein [Erysipelotrichaceae bacterium]|jgi:dTDP-4-dehydrorhamnose reductase|nr:sugar nucleotide-binding protein [Erysipelotrichaceae bacterium]